MTAIAPTYILTPDDDDRERERVRRETQTVNTLLRAQVEREARRTQTLFDRWRESGSPIEDDIFPPRGERNGAVS